jgi:hypothetical protein
MLEIVLMIWLCKKIGRELREKGQNPTWYQVLTVVLWVGGEILGMLLGTLIGETLGGDGEPDACFAYLLALLGAAGGAGLAYLIASNVPPAFPKRDDFDDAEGFFDPKRPPRPEGPDQNDGEGPDDQFRR